MRRPVPDPAGPGQESVWDYPRPPGVHRSSEHVVVEVGGRVLADTHAAIRVLETSHPPTYYLPASDVDLSLLRASRRRSVCEFKGVAVYHDLVVGDIVRTDAVWSYPEPTRGFEAIASQLAVYPQAADRITVDGEEVRAVQGDVYGGWVTSRVVGPFKGAAVGSRLW